MRKLLEMTINIVCTSKPVDGLLYYSYEYCSLLNDQGLDARVIIVCHRNFTPDEYIKTIKNKYIHCKNIIFNNYTLDENDVVLVMGRSMITLSWQDFKDYTLEQQTTLKKVFGGKVISVYSENHPTKYPLALDFYKPIKIVDLCDTEVYPNGVGDHFEKIIYFDIYKQHKDDIKFKHLFLGTNNKYYATIEKVIDQYPDHGILTYNSDYINKKNNNIFVPVENLMSMFDTYVYTKETFDPAPRIIQECKFFNKKIIYHRDKSIVDGGSIYWKRKIKTPDTTPILNAYERIIKK
jgi:hypothetical protein